MQLPLQKLKHAIANPLCCQLIDWLPTCNQHIIHRRKAEDIVYHIVMTMTTTNTHTKTKTKTKTETKTRMILNSLNKDIWSLEMSRLHQLAIRDRGYFDILVSDRIHSTKLFEKKIIYSNIRFLSTCLVELISKCCFLVQYRQGAFLCYDSTFLLWSGLVS